MMEMEILSNHRPALALIRHHHGLVLKTKTGEAANNCLSILSRRLYGATEDTSTQAINQNGRDQLVPILIGPEGSVNEEEVPIHRHKVALRWQLPHNITNTIVEVGCVIEHTT